VQTSETQIHSVWDYLTTQAEVGGVTCSIYSYNVEWDQGSAGSQWYELIGVESIYLLNEFVQDELVTSGQEYQFKVRAKNKHGWGAFTAPVTVLAAVRPEAPVTVTSSQNLLQAQFDWSYPIEHGSPVHEYEILIQNSVGDFIASPECDGQS
jgi:hypothetical protein